MLHSIFTLTTQPSWTSFFINLNELIDEIDFIQLGQQGATDFTAIDYGLSGPTKFNKWPTKDRPVLYKFNSFWIELGQSRKTIEQ